MRAANAVLPQIVVSLVRGVHVTASVLLNRLRSVRQTGADRWLARCPAHADRNPSLSIRELGDGRVLVHCFAGCAVQDVLAAVELGFDALFPEHVGAGAKRERRPFPSSDVLRCIATECLIVAVVAGNLRQGVTLTDVDYHRLVLAAVRLRDAADLAYGH